MSTRVDLGMPGLGRPEDPLSSGISFPEASVAALANGQLRTNLARATGTISLKRAHVVAEVDDWQELRESGALIKADAMRRLPELLEMLEGSVTRAGGHVHWAADAEEANAIVLDLIRATGSDQVVKVKSMATQEIGLNEALLDGGVKAIETDLAELIVQLADDRPSHILVPAIHRNRDEILEIFRKHLPGVDVSTLSNDPAALAAASRQYLRSIFLDAKVAISGANFAVAESGTLVVVESEGNGRMCLTLPETLITVMGIEKVIPTWRDLEVFLQLLPRSSTGERMNPYTSMWTGTHDLDGPQNVHLVLIDNGRTKVLEDPQGREALHCIRCSACLNVCPVYRRTGGHAYGSVYPGPIGAILTPQLTGYSDAGDASSSLPFASSLCGACYDVCPVKIDIPSMLVHLRATAVEHHRGSSGASRIENFAMKATGRIMRTPWLFRWAQRLARLGLRVAGKGRWLARIPGAKPWLSSRDLPALHERKARR